MIIDVYKANSFANKPTGATIQISMDLGEMNESLQETSARFQKDADKIVDLMVEHLPGGTLSRIHATLTERYANTLAIVWEEMKNK